MNESENTWNYFRAKAREIKTLSERMTYLDNEYDKYMVSAMAGTIAYTPNHETIFSIIQSEKLRTIDLILFDTIETKAGDLEKDKAILYLIDCRELYTNYPADEKATKAFGIHPLRYFETKDMICKIDELMTMLKAEPVQQSEFKKIKWKGSVASLGFILSQFAEKGFIDWPLDNRGEPKYTPFARYMSKIFEYDGTLETFIQCLYLNSDRFSDENKNKFKIPFLKEL